MDNDRYADNRATKQADGACSEQGHEAGTRHPQAVARDGVSLQAAQAGFAGNSRSCVYDDAESYFCEWMFLA